jgi:hypothetical protein
MRGGDRHAICASERTNTPQIVIAKDRHGVAGIESYRKNPYTGISPATAIIKEERA